MNAPIFRSKWLIFTPAEETPFVSSVSALPPRSHATAPNRAAVRKKRAGSSMCAWRHTRPREPAITRRESGSARRAAFKALRSTTPALTTHWTQ